MEVSSTRYVKSNPRSPNASNVPKAPLLLPLFSMIPQFLFESLTLLLYITIDLLCAYELMQIAESGEAQESLRFKSPRKTTKQDSILVGAAYLFNPLTIGTCLGRPTSLFTNCAILFSISCAINRKTISSMLSLALASYLSLSPILILPPVILLCYDRQQRASKSKVDPLKFAQQHLGAFAGAAALLLYLSYFITGMSWEFLASTYGVQLLLPDLTPNTGLWWYFFIEMFDSFREFFLGVFWLHLASYTAGICIRLRTQPLFAITTLLGLAAIFKPYPSISDTSLYFGLLPLYRHIFPLMRYTFIEVAILLYGTLLGPAFYWLWIYAGSGNANFFYAITLVWSLGLSVMVADSLFAVLRDEWEVERPEMKGQAVRQI
jgi:phosphatidylinositol glycan class U